MQNEKENQYQLNILTLLGCNEPEYNQQARNKLNSNQITNIVENLVKHLRIQYKAFIQYEEIDDQVFLITFPLEVHNSLCTLQFEIKLNFPELNTQFLIFLIGQDGRILVKEKNIRLQLSRYMLRLNSGFRVGSFFINPIHGYVGLKLQCQTEIADLIYTDQIKFDEFIKYVDSLITTGLHSLRFHYIRILILINHIKITDLKIFEQYMDHNRYAENENKMWRKLPPEIINILQRIKNTLQKNLNQHFDQKEYESYGPIIQKQVLTDSKIINQIQPVSENELSIDKNQEINSGGFGTIFGKDISYIMENDKDQKKIKKHLAIKIDSKKNEQKVQKELKILSFLSQEQILHYKNSQRVELKYFKFSGTCPYITQFYNVQERTDILLMERYYHSSLNNFLKKQEESISLSTKLFIAHSIAMGLRYCHYYGIIHMDIKPSNILISRSLLAKITDFGEAVNKNMEQKNYSIGRTMPYCAPEIMRPFNINNITPAYDIFSFGVILFELIFERNPFNFQNQNQKILEEKYLKQSYTIKYDEEYDKTLGPQKLMKYLGRLCLACLQPDPKIRPNIDKIILILKDSLSYLDRMY
ncbi:unnamed protein product [Paramecium sonneborni]|uniref:Protein kinase domain-containing protein n=1 Tax=Paramecium sonneborni TaxID=65129 RepID=A0A8S1RF08_9CILI|nr:unnamed protein product [Paramecium sonneborni]